MFKYILKIIYICIFKYICLVNIILVYRTTFGERCIQIIGFFYYKKYTYVR